MKTLFLVVFGILASAIIGTAVIATSFSQERVITLKKEKWDNQPLEIVSVKKDGQELGGDGQAATGGVVHQFSGNDDWLKGSEIVFENKFSKTITYFDVEVSVPDPTGRVAGVVTPIAHIGSPTIFQGTLPTFSLLPGELHILKVDEKAFAIFEHRMVERGARIPDHVDIRVNTVMFEDDTMWRFGKMLRRDPADPNKWDVIQPSSLNDQKKNNKSRN